MIPRIYQLKDMPETSETAALAQQTQALMPLPSAGVGPNPNPQMEIWHYFQIVGRWFWLILLCTVVGAAVSFAVSTYLVVPVYRAATTLMVKTRGLTNQNAFSSRGNDYDTFLADEYMTTTFKELAQKRPVAEVAARALHMDLAKLYGHIQVDIIPKTPLLVVSFDSPDPSQALTVNSVVATNLIQLAQESEWIPGRELAVIEPAVRPQAPVSPRIWLNTAIAAVVGCVLALAGVFFLEYARFVQHA